MTSPTRDRRPSILVVGCGGSISSVRSGDGAAPQLDASQLVADLPGLDGVATIEARSFSVIPSAHTSLDDVVRLHGEIEGALGMGAFDGVVVTHGTDTLEEVAFALDLLWDDDRPLVITGAMRNASLPSPDGAANILASIATAAAPSARGLGVLAVLDDEIHAAGLVRKSHTSNLAAFRSPSAGPIGYVTEGEARILLEPRRQGPVRLGEAAPSTFPVALLTMSIGDDGRLLESVLPCGYRGLVLEAFGGGHLTRDVAESAVFHELVDTMPVVLSSRTGAGEVLRSSYSGWPGSEMDVLGRGAISSGVLDGRKARILLMFLLASGADRVQIENTLARHGRYAPQAASSSNVS